MASKRKEGPVRYETRGVLAGAYTRGAERLLTHSVAITADGVESAVCRRVKLENLADRYAGDTSAAPSCRGCYAALKKAGR